ncbi:MAG: TonB-dependent receptor plug domain-containing protein [Bacteroidota bacterium]
MRVVFLFILYFIIPSIIFPQNIFKAIVKEKDSNQRLPGVNAVVIGTTIGASTNEDGYVEIKHIPPGLQKITFSLIGYEKVTLELFFPPAEEKVFEINMMEEAEEYEEISVTSTRTSRLIDDEPTRVEAITIEEIEEKSLMDPSNISMHLNESTGIQVQQTSASSVNTTFRIQGLDGKYTQLLRDGFPIYSGFSGSLSINQIPPLDLGRIEIIKGSTSTLYGGGAIAGLVNLISKLPQKKRELSFIINGTTAMGLDLSGYLSQKNENTGYTFFASRNTQKAYDNNDDKFSDLPEIERYIFNPKLFFYINDKSTLQAGASFSSETRIGGSIPQINGTQDPVYTYTEKNKSNRLSTQVLYELKIGNDKNILIKNSLGYFDRRISIPDYYFAGNQFLSYSEVNYSFKTEKHDWIFGFNLLTDDFTDLSETKEKRSYAEATVGVFAQNIFNFSDDLILESGIRTDYNKDFGWFLLPRLSLLIKWNPELTSRIGGGLGYKIPNIFTEQAEELFFKNISALDKKNVNAEHSFGFNLDLNYKTVLFEIFTFSINQLFFYTRINDPLTLIPMTANKNYYTFISLNGRYNTKGAETNIKFTYGDIKLFIGYTFLDTKVQTGENEEVFPLTPTHKLGLVLMYEEQGNLRMGLEAYYTSSQKLRSREKATDFWITGFMIEKMFSRFSLFVNFENIFDTRQSKFGDMFTGSPSNPAFEDIYAQTDGRIFNAGIKFKF